MQRFRDGQPPLLVLAWLLVVACDLTGIGSWGIDLDRLAGDHQNAPAGTLLPLAVSLSVSNKSGDAMPNKLVQFFVTLGDGAISDSLVHTNSSGVATTEWYVGPRSNTTNRLRATVDGEILEFTAQSTAVIAGLTHFGDEQYMEYLPGDLPLIITAPHGGTLVPATIPDRTGADIETARDSNTEELARTIRDVFIQRTGHRPHVIICRLRRTKLDANREIVEAAQGNRIAQRAWFEFHHFTAAAKSSLLLNNPRGLYMDLHGHGHAIPRLELGYLLTSSQLQLPDATLLSPTYTNLTSIRSLVQSGGTTLPQLLRGPFSLGTLFEQEGYSAVPSALQPDPGAGNDYFNGGYNTARHGSRDGGTISGFQLEANFAGVRDNAANRLAFANSIVDVFIEYMSRHYGIVIP